MAALSAFSKYNSSRAVDLCRQQMEGMRTCCLPVFHLKLLWYQPYLHISGLWTSWYVLGRTGWCTAWAAFQWCHNGLPPQAHRAPETMSLCCTWAEEPPGQGSTHTCELGWVERSAGQGEGRPGKVGMDIDKNIKGATSSHMLSWISAWIPALPATSKRPACLSWKSYRDVVTYTAAVLRVEEVRQVIRSVTMIKIP